MSNVSEFVQVPYYSDLDRYCRRINAERLERERQTLDFSPHYKSPPKIWKPDDDRLLALFMSIDPLCAAMTYEFLRKMTVGSWKDEPIWLSVNSYGGHAQSGVAMYESIREVVQRGVRVSVMVYGYGNSAASLVVQAASEGCRFAMESSWMLIHPPKWIGKQPPNAGERKHVRQFRKRMCEIYAARSGKTVDRLMRDTRRDLYLNAFDALKYGLIDGIDGVPTSLPVTNDGEAPPMVGGGEK